MVRTAGGGQFDRLEPALFELALYLDAGLGLLHVQNQRGVGQAEQFGDNDAGLAQSQIFRLQSGQHQVGILRLCRGGQQPRHAQRIARAQIVADDMDGPVRALGQSFADGRAHALRAGAHDNHFAAVLLLELQRLFKRIGVWLVHRVLQLTLFNPFAGSGDVNRGVAVWNLFDSNNDFHDEWLQFILAHAPS